jgi:hypothetical protein
MCLSNKDHNKNCPVLPIIFRVLGMVFLGITFAASIALIFAGLVMLLWNCLMPELFNLPVITYWQSAGLIFLCRILFSSFGSCSSKSSKKEDFEKWMGCNKEESEFGQKNYQKFWHEKGKNCFKEYFNKFEKNKDKKNR